jgi:hypothetical protein
MKIVKENDINEENGRQVHTKRLPAHKYPRNEHLPDTCVLRSLILK